ncbi:hypothetical protein B0H15DRAFT_944501 [Mycena belliarum]|uniref:DUF7729 domain-containing protein n=1 Tax=Mycena belliarum TaxID=1033014 RepID=A0AAD6UE51_9AGAR|nr:hypothetical protein B0H15DRAFT_944501 [Mycena belliae]
MFTPPPSPGPPPPSAKGGILIPDTAVPVSAAAAHPMSPDSLKRRIGRRTRWTVILVPLVLVLITASTRYLTHPSAFDMFSQPTLNWETLSNRASDWAPHKRHPLPAPVDVVATTLSLTGTLTGSFSVLTGSSSAATATSTLPPTSDQTIPTVPASRPPLPTPFPQPFDSGMSQNFSSVSCFNFFANMTNTAPFRSCRAFSLLIQSSGAFIQAQDNLTSLNNIVWGTCNPDVGDDECLANMNWFSQSLASSCAVDLKDGNSMALGTQTALNAFALMRDAGCVVDPSTNTYCYLDAVRNSNPSDTYFYSLPLGVRIPNNTIASCSACTKSLMTMYYSALGNTSQGAGLTSLKRTYDSAAKVAAADCGTAYATLTTGRVGGAPVVRAGPALLVGALLVLAFSLSLY